MKDMVMDDKLKEKVELSILFDFYGELLKNHNKHVFEDYILNDLSLSEIAEDQGISRQGVYDIVKRCSRQLKDYEEKLCLVKKFEETKAKVNQIKEISEQMMETNHHNCLEEIIMISDKILKDL
ncbi:YlxM family DNA-binding protein [Anaerocolumna sp. MB42-C2]|uniref:YlxM family DNA-binding protein n=1 Tax=Anaerocolumna sp. MB42-C2 TaxID=3070997 RepID=UPI0027E098B8|nr:DNA-binding protein [Anaerocolumna sp. MB42-C2]WMJ88297.1 DNA-binding protein [Anaerocolumna sp. MB42-C2]